MNKLIRLIGLVLVACFVCSGCVQYVAVSYDPRHVDLRAESRLPMAKTRVAVADLTDNDNDLLGDGYSYWLHTTWHLQGQSVSQYIRDSLVMELSDRGLSVQKLIAQDEEEAASKALAARSDYLVCVRSVRVNSFYAGYLIIPFVSIMQTDVRLQGQVSKVETKEELGQVDSAKRKTSAKPFKIFVLDSLFDVFFVPMWFQTDYGKTVAPDAVIEMANKITKVIQEDLERKAS